MSKMPFQSLLLCNQGRCPCEKLAIFELVSQTSAGTRSPAILNVQQKNRRVEVTAHCPRLQDDGSVPERVSCPPGRVRRTNRAPDDPSPEPGLDWSNPTPRAIYFPLYFFLLSDNFVQLQRDRYRMKSPVHHKQPLHGSTRLYCHPNPKQAAASYLQSRRAQGPSYVESRHHYN